MAVIRNTAAMRLKGRVGNTTYYTEGGRQLARVSQNSSNYGETASRTETQQFQRGKWGNLVNFYKVSAKWMKKAFTSKAAKQSDYNRFMQLNVSFSRVYLTKSMYASGGVVVDAFKVTEGNLRPINVTKSGSVYSTDLALGNLVIDVNTTVKDFSAALVLENSHVVYGMQISFISYQQEVSSQGIPSIICTAYEVTLSDTDTSKLRGYLPEFCSSSVGGMLGTNNNISVGAFCYVLSNSTSGNLEVSSQSLITNNDVLLASYTSEVAKAECIASYGVDDDVFLTSGSRRVQAANQPISIEGIDCSGTIYPSGSEDVQFGEFATSTSSPNLLIAGNFNSVTNVKVRPSGYSNYFEAISIIKVDGGVKVTFDGGGHFGRYITSIVVTIDGLDYVATYYAGQENE